MNALGRNVAEAGVLEFQVALARRRALCAGFEFFPIHAGRLNIDARRNGRGFDAGRIDHDEAFRRWKPNPPIERPAAGFFLLEPLPTFNAVKSGVIGAGQIIHFPAGEVIEILEGKAKKAPAGIDPDVAAIVRLDRVDDVVEQSLLAGDGGDFSIFETGQPLVQAGPQHALFVFAEAYNPAVWKAIRGSP